MDLALNTTTTQVVEITRARLRASLEGALRMSLEAKLYSLLSGTTRITDVVSSRIHPVLAPQETKFPLIVYTKGASQRVNSLTGYAGLEQGQMMIDIYADNYSDIKDLSTRIHGVLDAATTIRCLLISETDMFETGLDMYHLMQDWSVWNQE